MFEAPSLAAHTLTASSWCDSSHARRQMRELPTPRRNLSSQRPFWLTLHTTRCRKRAHSPASHVAEPPPPPSPSITVQNVIAYRSFCSMITADEYAGSSMEKKHVCETGKYLRALLCVLRLGPLHGPQASNETVIDLELY